MGSGERTTSAPTRLDAYVSSPETVDDPLRALALPRLADGEHVAGRYVVEGFLGRGGFAEVYRVRDLRRRGALRALKLHRAVGFRPALEALREEFAVLSALRHPNLARVHELGRLGEGVAYLTQGVAPGVRLDAAGLRLGDAVAVQLVVQLCRALEHLHARGILHRDVKPANVFVDLAGPHTTLLDFGIAQAFARLDPGVVAGTHPYLPPEAMLGIGLDPRADLFALGVTLHRVATGAVPFRGPDEAARNAPPRIAEALAPGPIADVVQRLLAASPADRFGSAGEVAEALSRAAGLAPTAESGQALAGYVLSAPWQGDGAKLDALVEHVTRAAPTRVIVVQGELGTGKTRLLRELRRRVLLAGGAFLDFECATDDQGISVLGEIGNAVLTPEVIARLSEDDRIQMARALPQLRRPRERIAVAVDPEHARILRVEGLARAIALRFAGGPAVLAIDAFDHAATPVAIALGRLLETVRSVGAVPLVLVAGRPSAALERVRAQVECEELTLGALDESAARQLLGAMLADERLAMGAEFDACVRAPCSPLWLEELLRCALDERLLVRARGRFVLGGPAAPRPLDEILGARLGRLGDEDAAVLRVLAVLGRASSLSEVAQVAHVPLPRVASSLRAAVALGFVEARDGARVQYALEERFRERVLRDGADAIALTRRRAGQALAKKTRDFEELARAARLLELGGDARAASVVYRRATEEAVRAGRPDRAVVMLDQALATGAPADMHTRIEQHLLRHALARRAGLRVESRDSLDVLATLRVRATKAQRAEIDLCLAEDAHRAGRVDEARRRCAQAVRVAPAGLPTSRKLALLAAELEADFGRLPEAAALYESVAVDAGRDHEIACRAWLGVALCAQHLGDFARAERAAKRAAAKARDPRQRSEALRARGSALRERGHVRSACDDYRRAVRDARRAGSPEDEAKALSNLGTTAQWLGAFDEARAALDRAILLKRQLGAVASTSVSYNNLGSLLLVLGQHDDAERALRTGLAAMVQSSPRIVASLRSNLADLDLLRGALEPAIEGYRDALALSAARGNLPQLVHTRSGLVRALLQAGKLAEVETLVPELEANVGAGALAEAARRVHLTLALAAQALGALGTARVHADRALSLETRRVQFAEVLGTPLESVWLDALLRGDGARRGIARGARALLSKHVARLPEAARAAYVEAHPLHRAIVRGERPARAGCLW